MNTTELSQLIDLFAPLGLQESWDNCGYNVDMHNESINKILLCLDVTQDVADEAVRKNCDVIISHHPLLFHGVKQINTGNDVGTILETLIRNGISLYCAHTTMDNSWMGLNAYVAGLLHVGQLTPLIAVQPEKMYKVSVTAPSTHIEKLRDEMFQVEAGTYGSYADSSFTVTGEGTFRPLGEVDLGEEIVDLGEDDVDLDETDADLDEDDVDLGEDDEDDGKDVECTETETTEIEAETTGQVMHVILGEATPATIDEAGMVSLEEARVDMLVREKNLERTLRRLRTSHPYHEPPIDVYEVRPNAIVGDGKGCIGFLDKAYTMQVLAERVKEILKCAEVKFTGNPEQMVQQVAVCTGAGRSLIDAAARQGADAFITGEVRYNDYLSKKFPHLIVAGHYDTEKWFVDAMRAALQAVGFGVTYNIEICASEDAQRPYVVV